MKTLSSLNQLIKQLDQREWGQIHYLGSSVVVRIHDDHSKLSLSTVVYQGGNYIPKSVRSCLQTEEKPVSWSSIRTSLSLDEAQFQVHLNYMGHIEHIDKEDFIKLLEEFCQIAEVWRDFLDEHDRHDLIYIHHRK